MQLNKEKTVSILQTSGEPMSLNQERSNDDNSTVLFLSELFDELFPICRSITGAGLRQSLELFGRHMPLCIEKVPSGTAVFDWTVPPEWVFQRARLTGPDGTVLADSEVSNLHVVNYSVPVDIRCTLDELKPHLHSIPELPHAIPYVTSYYKRDWGFCLPYETVQHLPEGSYHAIIDSDFIDGCVDIGSCVLPGESTAEVLLSTYLCHPSLANNELSGPLVLLGLYQRLALWPRRRFTYRFVINPETIGSLCYLHLHGRDLQATMVAGLVLTCLGGPSQKLSYKFSRRNNSLLDRTVRYLHQHSSIPLELRPFEPAGGSDERQYCSPGFNLPVGQMARTVYGHYPGYHNSLDTKEFMDVSSILRSVNELEDLLQTIELVGPFRNLYPYGEPQLGKRDLYPNLNGPSTRVNSADEYVDNRAQLTRIMNILSYSDGDSTLLDIADRCHCDVMKLQPIIEKLEKNGLIVHDYPRRVVQ